jgi:hypothetical protein
MEGYHAILNMVSNELMSLSDKCNSPVDRPTAVNTMHAFESEANRIYIDTLCYLISSLLKPELIAPLRGSQHNASSVFCTTSILTRTSTGSELSSNHTILDGQLHALP